MLYQSDYRLSATDIDVVRPLLEQMSTEALTAALATGASGAQPTRGVARAVYW